ncbi:MAG: hypothetical protein Q9168_006547, partial [Polycauliona sp. 1 TL-2023]
AAPLLYRANAFYFNDPHTLQQFRTLATYGKLSAWLEEITVELSDTINAQGGTSNTHLWQNYLSGCGPSKKIWRLTADFPHLKRLTVVLSNSCSLYPPPRLREVCNSFGQNLRGLDWVHVVGLNNVDMVSSLKPMVCTSGNQDSEEDDSDLLQSELENVQKHITEYECASGWKNVTLWRGSPTASPPFVPSPMAGMGRERKHLFRFEMNGTVQEECVLHPDQRRSLLMAQNARLLRMAKDQVSHQPQDVSMQRELGDLRIDILNRKIGTTTSSSSSCPFFYSPAACPAQMDYQIQLMQLEHQNRKRLRIARGEQIMGKNFASLENLRDCLVEQEDKLRSLEIWVYHSVARRSIAELTREITKAKRIMQRLQCQIDEAVAGCDTAPNDSNVSRVLHKYLFLCHFVDVG